MVFALAQRLAAPGSGLVEPAGVRFSYEFGDIVSQVLNFGSPTPGEVTVWGKSFDSLLPYTMKLQSALERIPELRDVQLAETLGYPTINVNINRTLAGQLGVTVNQVATSVVDATATSVLISRNYWVDPGSGIPYPVEARVPPGQLAVSGALRHLPLMPIGASRPLVSDVAEVTPGQTMDQIDHLNNQRSFNLVANIEGRIMAARRKTSNGRLRRSVCPRAGSRWKAAASWRKCWRR